MNENLNTLPPSWAWTTLGEVAILLRGVTYNKSEADDKPRPGYLPILRATNIGDGLMFDGLVYVPESRVSVDQRLKTGDIVIAASSGSRNVVGKAARLVHPWDGSFGAFCFALRPASDVSASFIGFFMQTSQCRHGVSDLAAGVNINNLRRQHIEGMSLPLPPLPEQHRIVEEVEKQFSRLDAAVTGLHRVQKALKRYRAAVLQAACSGRLVPTEAELARAEGWSYETGEQLLARILTERRARWEAAGKKGKYQEPAPADTTGLSEIPEGWAWVSTEAIAELITKGSSPRWQGFEYQDRGVFFLRSQNVQWGYLDLSERVFLDESFNASHRRSVISEGDVLLNLVGASVGRSAIATADLAGANTNQAVGILRLVRGGMLNRFLVLYLLSPWGQAHITQAKADVARANFNLDDIQAMPVALPPLAEQERIVAEVERRLSVVEEVEAAVAVNLKRAERLRQAILKRAFEGRLVPQDPNDEPAAALLERIRGEATARTYNGIPTRAHGRRIRQTT